MSSPAAGSKRVLEQLYGGAETVGSSLLKKVKLDLTLESEKTDEGAEAGERTAFLPRNVQWSTRRDVLRATNAEAAGPSRLTGRRVSVGASVTTSSRLSLTARDPTNLHDAPSLGPSLAGGEGPDGGRDTRPNQPPQPFRPKNRNLEFVDRAQEHIVGPMPVRDFIDEFLHLDDEPSKFGLLSSWRAFRSVPIQADVPSGIYEPLIRAINRRSPHKARCPGFFSPMLQSEPLFLGNLDT
ncbi:hypothetical protein GSI_15134 [Ganoderma sinense ZZ0214-1]|uniref:Uncharacterized protein n=1 Tax=Ganoderma sinense ZZ0214-1 TaxID=1077348 RepID=A0A2G8RLQ2_9APHY|nr:hypothetical protein GSI_15134 [Ganoderma sinense ZZ0214-1]